MLLGRLPALLSAGSILLFCSESIRESEPNDRPEAAQKVAANATIVGTFKAAGPDQDCFRPQDSDSAQIGVELSGIKGVDSEIRIFSGNDLVKSANDAFSSIGESLAPLHARNMVVCVRTVGRLPETSGREAEYKLQLRAYSRPNTAESEPNENLQSASPIRDMATGYYNAVFVPGADGRPAEKERDYYRLEIPGDGLQRLRIRLSGVPGIDPILKLLDERGRLLRNVDEKAVHQGEDISGFGVRGPATYYLVVSAKDLRINPIDYYELSVTTEVQEARFEFEPNDVPDSANPLSADEISGDAGDAGDIDFFRLVNSGVDPVVYSLEAISEGNAILEWRQAGRITLFNDHNQLSVPERINNRILAAGEEALVTVQIKSAVYPMPYTVKLNREGLIDSMETEPNDLPAQADDMYPDTGMAGFMNPYADRDSFRLNLASGGKFKLLVSGAEGCRLGVRISDSRNVVYHKTEARSIGSGISAFMLLQPGSFLQLSCLAHDETIQRTPYQIKLYSEKYWKSGDG